MHSTAVADSCDLPALRPSSSCSVGGADGGPDHDCFSCVVAFLLAQAELFLLPSGTALTGVLLGTDIGWTGVVSMVVLSLSCAVRTSVKHYSSTSKSETERKSNSHAMFTGSIRIGTGRTSHFTLGPRIVHHLLPRKHVH